MKIYNYIPITGEFLGSSEADSDPLVVGEFLIPAHATTIEPLAQKDGFTNVFNGVEWLYKEDHRGQEVYDNAGEKTTVDYLGAIKDGYTTTYTPPPPPPLTTKNIEEATSLYIDNIARQYGYDSIISARSYAGYVNDYQAEGVALGLWSSLVWSTEYALMVKIQAGEMAMPATIEEGIALLPKYAPLQQ